MQSLPSARAWIACVSIWSERGFELSRRSWRVLLADDDLVVQEVVRSAAASAGHRVTAATSGAQAFELALSMQPDIIVLDLSFPDADGRDILAKLKANATTMLIPVLVWSAGRGNDSDSRISLTLGAEDYVQKDDAQSLIRKLERVLFRLDETDQRSVRSPSWLPHSEGHASFTTWAIRAVAGLRS